MVIFLVPAVVSLFTGVIGGVAYHFISRNNRQNQNPEGQNTNTQNSQQSSNIKQQNSKELQLKQIGQLKKITQDLNQNISQEAIEETLLVKNNEELQKDQDGKQFICPLTNQLINQPAQLFCGHCFERKNLLQYIKKIKKCPVCEKKARFSEIGYPQQFKNILDQYKKKKRARKYSRDRLIQDFGDDAFQLKISHEQKAHSDTEGSSDKDNEIKLNRYSSINYN